jgi:hypothetical protein
MTPKEKAEELVDKFMDYSEHRFNINNDLSPVYTAKQCALIAVDEIIKECCKSSEKKDAKYQDERINYWQQVKHEIENI